MSFLFRRWYFSTHIHTVSAFRFVLLLFLCLYVRLGEANDNSLLFLCSSVSFRSPACSPPLFILYTHTYSLSFCLEFSSFFSLIEQLNNHFFFFLFLFLRKYVLRNCMSPSSRVRIYRLISKRKIKNSLWGGRSVYFYSLSCPRGLV